MTGTELFQKDIRRYNAYLIGLSDGILGRRDTRDPYDAAAGVQTSPGSNWSYVYGVMSGHSITKISEGSPLSPMLFRAFQEKYAADGPPCV